MRLAVVVLLMLTLAACQLPAGGGGFSPSQPSSAGAGLGQGAQTIGGSQGAAQTPQTTPGGQASQIWHFASLMPFETLTAILSAAKEQEWTSEQVINAIKAASGAPQTVTITTQAMTIQGGSATTTGASSGAGAGGTAGTGGPVTNR